MLTLLKSQHLTLEAVGLVARAVAAAGAILAAAKRFERSAIVVPCTATAREALQGDAASGQMPNRHAAKFQPRPG